MAYSLSDIESRLHEAMDEAGMAPASGQRIDVVGGKTCRYQINGDRQGTKNGAFCVYVDERPSGWLQNWKSGDKLTFTMKDLPALSASDKERFRQEMEQARVDRAQEAEKEHAKVAAQARQQWNSAKAAAPDHSYLTKKGVSGYTLKQDGETLLVPLYDKDSKKIINLQRIFPSGDKRPITGGRMKGVFSPIGRSPNGPVLVCEGWATGATLYKLTGYTVVCAMTAGNLPEIARMVKLMKEDREVLICADNDHATERKEGKNPGKTYANKAAEAAKLGVPIWPDFTPEEDGSDWNDYMLLHGEDSARGHFNQKFKEAHAIFDEPPSAKVDTTLFPDVNIRTGRPLATIENVETLLRHYKIQAKYNEITKAEEIDFPKIKGEHDGMLESNTDRIKSLAARHEIPTTNVASYVDVIARTNAYNPVRDWILSRAWDNTPRLAKFIRTVEVQDGFDEQISDMMISKWMISAVASVFEEINNDKPFSACGVLVLQGEQGCGKTTWFRNLAPAGSGWIGEGKHIDPSKKDSMMVCLRTWITELGELESTIKKDMATLKAFITNTVDSMRLPYARRVSTFPRRTVFGASVNQSEFLTDSTGNRRWWCIPVKSMKNDHDLDIQQVWAEVYSQYEDGYKWYPDHAEELAIERSTWKFLFPDRVTDLLLDKFSWADYPTGFEQGMTATEVLRVCGVENPNMTEVKQCGIVLRKLTGREPHKGAGGQRLYYLPPTKQ